MDDCDVEGDEIFQINIIPEPGHEADDLVLNRDSVIIQDNDGKDTWLQVFVSRLTVYGNNLSADEWEMGKNGYADDAILIS